MEELYATLTSPIPQIPAWVLAVSAAVLVLAVLIVGVLLTGTKDTRGAETPALNEYTKGDTYLAVGVATVLLSTAILVGGLVLNVRWIHQYNDTVAKAAAVYVLEHEDLVPFEGAAVYLAANRIEFHAARSNGDRVLVTTTWEKPLVAGTGNLDQLVKISVEEDPETPAADGDTQDS